MISITARQDSLKHTKSVYWALVLLIAVCLIPLDGAARTIHVDGSQARPGNGSKSAPYGTIAEAAKHVGPGDVVAVAPGVYEELVLIRRGGSKAHPVVFRPMKAGTVLIDGRRTKADTDLIRINADHVIFQGFEVRNARRSAIAVWGARGVTIRENVISASARFGIWAGHGRPGSSRDILIEKNIVYGNVLENRARNWSSGWARAIAVDLTNGALVRNNRVFKNFGEGIGVLSSKDIKIYRNVVYDNFSVNIYLDNVSETTVSGNVVYTKLEQKFYRHGRPAIGIAIANEHTKWPKPSMNIRVSDNKLTGVGDVIYGKWGANTGLRNSVIGPNQIN